MAVQIANLQNGILAAPASATSTSPISGTHDNSIAGGPYRASNAPARRTLADAGEAIVTAPRPSQYVVQAPRRFPVVATITGTSQASEFLTTTTRGTSDESGRMVAAAKLQAKRTMRLRRLSRLNHTRNAVSLPARRQASAPVGSTYVNAESSSSHPPP